MRSPFAPFLIESVNVPDPVVLEGEDDAQATARLAAELREAIEHCGPSG